jgi:hypothetical protein
LHFVRQSNCRLLGYHEQARSLHLDVAGTPHQHAHQFGAPTDICFEKDALEMRPCRIHADTEVIGRLFDTEAVHQQLGNGAFRPRQSE